MGISPLANQAILPTELGDTIALTYNVTDDGVDTIPATGSFVLTVVDTPVSITPPTDADLMADENDGNWALQLEAYRMLAAAIRPRLPRMIR